jgi:hypothetical protein
MGRLSLTMRNGEVMELANILLALGGDRGNTVPKFNVTPAEIAVLCAIHGSDSVFDIKPTGETLERSNRDERERLLETYPALDQDKRSIVLSVYPGSSPILHTELADLGLDETLFKAETHVTPKPATKKKPAKVEKPAPISDIVPEPAGESIFDD